MLEHRFSWTRKVGDSKIGYGFIDVVDIGSVWFDRKEEASFALGFLDRVANPKVFGALMVLTFPG
ncbi:hypothetical protein NONO_c24620 [Nocardia nova SH22a]|uniref:Uncharacterized protein n=1 Tax=Nocardia nova SH22a TaxID=1415166 RepID=W5TE27_9NOCA|nr:hypothetical protein NONO_c24620 [Nocardia nova SH22a]